MHPPIPCKDLDEETARDLTVSYAAGTCAPAERLDFETHCLSCDECRSTLAIVLRRAFSPADEEESKALATLYPIGMEAARIARRLSGIEVSIYDEKISPSESPFPAGRMAAIAV